MSKNIEIEAKTLISKEEYDTLVASINNEKMFSQLNYYFVEGDKSPKESSLAIRIRKEEDKIEATAKIALKEGKLEINQLLSDEEYAKFLKDKKFPKGEVADFLYENCICDPSNLVVFATLLNNRIEFKYKSCLIAIDKSEYLNHTDYEVECEGTSMRVAREILKEYLEKKKIPFKENHISKLKRVKNAI